MSIQPQGETIRKAVKWVSQQRQSSPAVGIQTLVDQAAMQFNLTPKEADFLARTLTSQTDEPQSQ